MIEFEIGGKMVESTMISNVTNNPNFSDPVLFLEVVKSSIIFLESHKHIYKYVIIWILDYVDYPRFTWI